MKSKTRIAVTLISAIVLSIAGAILVLTATQPAYYRVQRSIQIKAPLEKVYSLVADPSEWHQWSPWILKPEEIEILDKTPNERVRVFIHSHSTNNASNADFLFVETEKEVLVTWGMDFHNKTLKEKFYYKMKNFKLTLEQDFEAGLKNIKAVAEEQDSKSTKHKD